MKRINDFIDLIKLIGPLRILAFILWIVFYFFDEYFSVTKKYYQFDRADVLTMVTCLVALYAITVFAEIKNISHGNYGDESIGSEIKSRYFVVDKGKIIWCFFMPYPVYLMFGFAIAKTILILPFGYIIDNFM